VFARGAARRTDYRTCMATRSPSGWRCITERPFQGAPSIRRVLMSAGIFEPAAIVPSTPSAASATTASPSKAKLTRLMETESGEVPRLRGPIPEHNPRQNRTLVRTAARLVHLSYLRQLRRRTSLARSRSHSETPVARGGLSARGSRGAIRKSPSPNVLTDRLDLSAHPMRLGRLYREHRDHVKPLWATGRASAPHSKNRAVSACFLDPRPYPLVVPSCAVPATVIILLTFVFAIVGLSCPRDWRGSSARAFLAHVSWPWPRGPLAKGAYRSYDWCAHARPSR